MRPLHTRVCEECGVPAIWSRDSVLDGDNTSLQKMIPMRGVFYEVDEVGSLIDGIEREVGVSLDRLVFTAHKRAIRRFFTGTLKGASGAVARKAAPRLIYDQQAKVAPLFGVGLMEEVGYERGGPLVVEARNAWNERLAAAEVAGAFEAVEGTECEVESHAAGDLIRLVARRSEEREEYSGRLVPMTGELMGDRQYTRCHTCGAPVSFRVFEWHRDSGEIRERDNGIRVVHQTVACVDGLLEEMRSELGDEICELATRRQADFVRERVASGIYEGAAPPRRDRKRRLFDCLGLIRRRCMGNPILMDLSDGGLKVNVRNPANDELVLGRVLGTYEALMERGGVASSQKDGGTLRIVIREA